MSNAAAATTTTTSPPEQLTRHDRRRLTEAYLSVQAAASELEGYLRELVAPSDGTAEEVVEVLTEQAAADMRTLQRAVGVFGDVVRSLLGYERLFGDAVARNGERMRAAALMGEVAVFVERLLVKAKTGQFAEGAQLATGGAKASDERVRELDALCRATADSFGYRDGTTLANDDASSSEDSDYAPEHDDDHGRGLVESDDDGEPAEKRVRTVE